MIRASALYILLLPVVFAAAGCDDFSAGGLATLLVAEGTTTARPGGKLVDGLVIKARNDDGEAAEPTELTITLQRGGGEVVTSTVTTDSKGEATIGWRLGNAPVPQVIEVSTPELALEVSLEVIVDPTLAPAPFGDVNAYMNTNNIDGSTEDLAFSPDGTTLALGVPGGLIEMSPDASITNRTLTGDVLDGPLGLAYTDDGTLWICDAAGSALHKVSPAGVVTTVLTNDGTDDLKAPNHLAIGPDGAVYFTDPCLGRVYRFDPATTTVTGQVQFDLATEGGPNGVAFGADGTLYLLTENTALLCGDGIAGLTDPIAGLYSTTVDGLGFTPKVTVAAGVGLFGDGLAFDAEGNLYTIFDTAVGFELDESIVFVLPSGGAELKRFFAVKDQLLANLLFGGDAFGTTTLYLTLLSVQPFVPLESRGVVTLDVGIAGAPLR
ncbi:MAG: sugar lactone lactonase YvrE [Myxococcota bacterium]|jgi:sugar lactone lactonase YvrE